jgi:hypothetical protein
MALLNYTTKIDPDKTASEIAKCLSMHGASAVMTEYDPVDGQVTALSFKVKMGDKEMGFRLPSDYKPVLQVLGQQWQQRKIGGPRPDKLQAVRVSWRIIKDWVEAQMALVETQMVTTAQVFLPYAVMKDGRTLTQHIETNPGFLLGDGK